MITIVSGTNRPNSNSLKVSKFYYNLLKNAGTPVAILNLSYLPEDFTSTALYDNQGKNPMFNELRDQLEVAEKVIFVVPEYNCSFPGVLKAFVDGLSYSNVMRGKKVALVGLSAGTMGGAIALSHFSEVLNYLGMEVFSYKVKLPFINRFISVDEIKNEEYVKWIHTQLNGFEKY